MSRRRGGCSARVWLSRRPHEVALLPPNADMGDGAVPSGMKSLLRGPQAVTIGNDLRRAQGIAVSDQKEPIVVSTAEPAADEPPKFERVVEELQVLVNALEAGNLPLDEALALYERGVSLARAGNQILEGAERKIEVLQRSLAGGDS